MAAHLYRHFGADNQLLYVGVSLNAVNRLGQHKSSSHWSNAIERVEIEAFDTRWSALEAERIAILKESPAYNLQHRPLDSLRSCGMRDLAAKQVASLRAPGKHRVSRNLYLQVVETGARTWLFRYERHGRGIGTALALTIW